LCLRFKGRRAAKVTEYVTHCCKHSIDLARVS
jgi:hypothetical protein